MSAAEELRGFAEHVYNSFINGANQLETTHGLRIPKGTAELHDKIGIRVPTHEQVNRELDAALAQTSKDLPLE